MVRLGLLDASDDDSVVGGGDWLRSRIAEAAVFVLPQSDLVSRVRLRGVPLDMDVIDTSWMDSNVHGPRHNYFNVNPYILGDVRDVIATKRRAHMRAGKLMHLGYFATAEEAALAYARTPEAQAEVAKQEGDIHNALLDLQTKAATEEAAYKAVLFAKEEEREKAEMRARGKQREMARSARTALTAAARDHTGPLAPRDGMPSALC